MAEIDAISRRQQAIWSAGDFHVIGVGQLIVGEILCEEIVLTAGARVLDVGCGAGNTSLAAARRMARVSGIDIVPALLDRARRRAEAEGLELDLREGDAQAVPYPDASFDVVLSTFGAMFAPDHERTASELLRVCRPGGTIGMANWTPQSFVGDLFRLTATFVPPSVPTRPAVEWGSGPRLRELFGDHLTSLRLSDHVWRHRFHSAGQWLEVFRNWFGPILRAFEALDEPRAAEYARELIALVHRHNRATDGTVLAAYEYVNVIGVKR
jgi:SAM-dependent methyltransferase